MTTIHGPAALAARSLDVPGDISSAAAWIVAAAIHRDAELRVTGVGLNPSRTEFINVLREMGAQVEVRESSDRLLEPVGGVIVRSGDRLKAVDIDPARVPALIDELPLIAVAMASAEGTSQVRGAAELRVKESDRLSAMGAALAAAGARIEQLDDGWRISAGRPRNVHVRTHRDHRLAMAMAIAAWTGVAGSTTLDDTDCVAVSYPGFWRDARALGASGGSGE
jgi:3-phosphoshikimate 1-carboxyvinyltransferase